MIDRTPRTTRRRLLAAAAVVTLSPSRVVFAQTYPAKPVRWIVPYPPGGGSDFLARTVGAQMEKQLGQPFVIENRPGAATMIGAEAVARGTADGYTLLSGDNGTFVFNTALYKKVPYDPAKDFAPVGLMARYSSGYSPVRVCSKTLWGRRLAYSSAILAAGLILPRGTPAMSGMIASTSEMPCSLKNCWMTLIGDASMHARSRPGRRPRTALRKRGPR